MTLTGDRVAAAASIFGDLFLAITITARRGSWKQPTVSTLRWMALADLITSTATVVDGGAIGERGAVACWIVAALYWYGAWASWLWNGAYAPYQ